MMSEAIDWLAGLGARSATAPIPIREAYRVTLRRMDDFGPRRLDLLVLLRLCGMRLKEAVAAVSLIGENGEVVAVLDRDQLSIAAGAMGRCGVAVQTDG